MPWPADAYPSPLWNMAESRGDHAALRYRDEAWTYRDWAHHSRVWAKTFRAHGVNRGQRVAVFGLGNFEHAAVLMALLDVGAVLAPQPLFEPPQALLARLKTVDAAFVWRPREAPAAVQEAIAESALPPLPSLVARDAEAASRPEPRTAWRLSRPWVVLCTSGSTGAPRAVPLCGQQIVSNAFAVASRVGSLPSDVWLAALPWHHVGGLMVLFRTLLCGTALHLCQPFEPRRAAALLDGSQVSLVPLVPTMLEKILNVRAARPLPARVRVIVLGGAPTTPPLLARARELSLPVATSWGMTETASQVATQTPFSGGPAEDVGAALPGVVIERTPRDALRVTGLMARGRIETRDRGFVDERHHVHVLGRLDDVLISGGENVPVEPIEAILREHPLIADAAVVGRFDAMWGERPVAFVVRAPHSPNDASEPSDEALVAFCRERMASFQRPVQFVWQSALPRDALGKLRRHMLRALVNEASR